MIVDRYNDYVRRFDSGTIPRVGSLQFIFIKRGIDILVSIVALFCLSPLLILTAFLIRAFDGKGPIFFLQKRNGRFAKPFTIYKFRTMKYEPKSGFEQCKADDIRLTAIGKILRKTSIDELPQLLNILIGDMSIVGPRPHPLELDEQFCSVLPNYMDRYYVRPGLTGWAQVLGRRGPTPTTKVMEARLEADLEYVRRNSILFDIIIMMRTIPIVFIQTNAQ